MTIASKSAIWMPHNIWFQVVLSERGRESAVRKFFSSFLQAFFLTLDCTQFEIEPEPISQKFVVGLVCWPLGRIEQPNVIMILGSVHGGRGKIF